MAFRRRSVAVVTLGLQVTVTPLATISVCVDRPHTHGGVPAPECATHRPSAPAPTPARTPGPNASDNHQHHAHHAPAHDDVVPATSRLSCRCTSDPVSLLTGGIGIVPNRLTIGRPGPAPAAIAAFVTAANDVSVTPLPPPPRQPLS